MIPRKQNLFADLPSVLPDELTQVLAESGGVRVERIVSTGHASPAEYWYDQDQCEWVALLRGAARLEFADDERVVELRPGDWLLIEAHQRHRVAWTSDSEPTVWLAVFFS